MIDAADCSSPSHAPAADVRPPDVAPVRAEIPEWIVEDVNHEDSPSACFAILVGRGAELRRYVPASCNDCGDTVASLESRSEDRDSAVCVQCRGRAFIWWEGTRDRISLLGNVAQAMFPQCPLTSALLECSQCERELELQYFREDVGNGTLCAWCMQRPA